MAIFNKTAEELSTKQESAERKAAKDFWTATDGNKLSERQASAERKAAFKKSVRASNIDYRRCRWFDVRITSGDRLKLGLLAVSLVADFAFAANALDKIGLSKWGDFFPWIVAIIINIVMVLLVLEAGSERAQGKRLSVVLHCLAWLFVALGVALMRLFNNIVEHTHTIVQSAFSGAQVQDSPQGFSVLMLPDAMPTNIEIILLFLKFPPVFYTYACPALKSLS
jgi:hypothetical protein